MLGDPQYKEGNDRFKRVLLKPLPNKKCGKFCRFSLFDSVYNAFKAAVSKPGITISVFKVS